MGETISYSSGKVQEFDVAKLVREARQKYHDTLPSYGHREVLNWYGYLALCDALEEREREVERLRIPEHGYEEMCAKYAKNMQECIGQLREAEAEVERLREELRVTRMERDHAWEN